MGCTPYAGADLLPQKIGVSHTAGSYFAVANPGIYTSVAIIFRPKYLPCFHPGTPRDPDVRCGVAGVGVGRS